MCSSDLSFICSLFGIRHVILAVNKMDMTGFDPVVFDSIVEEYMGFARGLDFETITPIPLSARFGDNVTSRSERTPWYDGPTLAGRLETIDAESYSPQLNN